MKVISEKKVLIVNVEYNIEEGRKNVFDWLDKKYGELKWRSRRSGPSGNGKGLIIAEIDLACAKQRLSTQRSTIKHIAHK